MLRLLLLFSTACGLGSAVYGQGLTPEQSKSKMNVPEGFMLELVAAEPLVRQPVTIDFDDRGRLWVIQYLQYPNPNGLKRVSVDRYSRTRYDRVPEPPPHGPRGDDRITILEDTDGDGRIDRAHDFIDGLNLATGMAFGHGGLFVLNVPYLLFYPDRNRDDVPDSDPEVLLTGFGMEDAHSVANSLAFGPDGWLYGCQGSTVTANIRGIEFQQGVWRYHPVTREFELFCEGGGNSWGLDFDRTGRLLYSTNFGGYTLLHAVQGGYFVKSFGKHGALHNPHAYGYFDHAPHQNFRGGHVTVGGIIYQGDNFPASYRGKYIAGDLLGHGVYWHSIHRRGSTVATSHGGELLTSQDAWFAPTDVTMGPDGAIYVTDWHDERTAHPDPDATWDRSNGRIYRIAAVGTQRTKTVDFTQSSAQELFELHQHPSQWYVRKARQEIVRRYGEPNRDERHRSEATSLRGKFHRAATTEADETAALEALWSLNLLGGFDEQLAMQLLRSPHPAVRSWTVRLLGDGRMITAEMAHLLDEFAEQEPEISVRQQLACSAARFPPDQAMPMINANINRDIDSDDPYLPLLWWWAVEKQSLTGREAVLKRFVRPTLWKSRLGRDFLLTRLIRRYTAERSVEGLDSVARLLKAAPDPNARKQLWPHVWLGWQEQVRDAQTGSWLESARRHEFSQLLLREWSAFPEDLTLLQLGCALRHANLVDAVTKTAFDSQAEAGRRVTMLGILGTVDEKKLLAPSLELLATDSTEPVRAAALQLIARFDDPSVPKELIRIHNTLKAAGLQSQIRDVILSRASSAGVWLEAVDRGEIPASSTSLEQIRRVALLDNRQLDALVTKHWGRLQGASREEKLAEVRRLNNDLRAAAGNVSAGHQLFTKHCAACHQLFGEGTKVGPDLTTANRQDRDYLLISLVDPSSVIRKEFVSVIIETTNGRVMTGLPIERNDAALTLVDSKGEKQSVSTAEIAELQDSPVSLMPENLYLQFKPAELRDLFAYLQSKR
ncbi:MAG: c-type cytochrome [Planctomycetes bacterium]|nr:c-type cytochrome [Planctomycetota bacterium]